MTRPMIVVIGASAGGMEPAVTILGSLPPTFPAAVLMVIHGGPGPTLLPDILARAVALRVVVPTDGDRLRPATLYLAPPDCHLMVDDGRIHVERGPRQNGFRPAVDPLFFSAARAYGRRVVGVILSGALSDGTAGLLAIKRAGGTAIVQHPEEAALAGMPLSALKNVEADAVLPAAEIGPRLAELVNGMSERSRRAAHPGETEDRTARARAVAAERPTRARRNGHRRSPRGRAPWKERSGETVENRDATLTPLRCPGCGGALWEIDESGLRRYECHVGHQYSEESLAAAIDGQLEDTLWSGVRALKDHAALRERMAQGAVGSAMRRLADLWREEAADSEENARRLRTLIESGRLTARDAERTGVKHGRAARVGKRKTTAPKR